MLHLRLYLMIVCLQIDQATSIQRLGCQCMVVLILTGIRMGAVGKIE